ncbi:hypothetical protein TNCV_3911831 [Trichonephila clavipes]|nr:hypothetical protein TNCV_3911831 [Trichonephila clavipes]
MDGDCKAKLAAGTVGFEAGVSLFTDPISDIEIITMGRTYLLKNSSGRSPLTDEKCPACCVMIGRDRSTQKVGVEKDWVDPKINDPKQGDLEIKFNFKIP